MSHDKKVLNGQLRHDLCTEKSLGQAIITKEFDVELMKQAILANQAEVGTYMAARQSQWQKVHHYTWLVGGAVCLFAALVFWAITDTQRIG